MPLYEYQCNSPEGPHHFDKIVPIAFMSLAQLCPIHGLSSKRVEVPSRVASLNSVTPSETQFHEAVEEGIEARDQLPTAITEAKKSLAKRANQLNQTLYRLEKSTEVQKPKRGHKRKSAQN